MIFIEIMFFDKTNLFIVSNEFFSQIKTKKNSRERSITWDQGFHLLSYEVNNNIKNKYTICTCWSDSVFGSHKALNFVILKEKRQPWTFCPTWVTNMLAKNADNNKKSIFFSHFASHLILKHWRGVKIYPQLWNTCH